MFYVKDERDGFHSKWDMVMNIFSYSFNRFKERLKDNERWRDESNMVAYRGLDSLFSDFNNTFHE